MMKKLIAALAGVAVLAGSVAFFASQKAHAVSVVMCAPKPASGAPGPRFITIPNTSANNYTLDANGCAPVNEINDAAYLATQGFYQGAGSFSIFGVVSSANASTAIGTLPPSTRIDSITIQETAGNSVTGGIKVGTTNGGNDVVAGITCAAGCINTASDVSMAKKVFSPYVSQPIFIGAVSAWNSANVSVTIRYSYF